MLSSPSRLGRAEARIPSKAVGSEPGGLFFAGSGGELLVRFRACDAARSGQVAVLIRLLHRDGELLGGISSSSGCTRRRKGSATGDVMDPHRPRRRPGCEVLWRWGRPSRQGSIWLVSTGCSRYARRSGAAALQGIPPLLLRASPAVGPASPPPASTRWRLAALAAMVTARRRRVRGCSSDRR